MVKDILKVAIFKFPKKGFLLSANIFLSLESY